MIGRGGQRGRGRGNREWNTKPPVTQNGPLMTDHLRVRITCLINILIR